MKFAHLADCHLGGWRLPELQQLNLEAFQKAIDLCINEEVDFVLIAGDLFDTAMPSIDILKETVKKLRELKEKEIACYFIAGSHDYSVSGKTFLEVLEKAGLCENLEKIENETLQITETKDALFAGISGKKGELEKDLIRRIKVPKLNEHKLKILVLHTTVEENKTNEFMQGININDLPKGFDYYALGHIHRPFEKEFDGKIVAYPGPLFPNSFSELEELENGGFFIVKADENIKIERFEIKIKNIFPIDINATGQSPELITSEIIGKIKKENIKDNIVLIKVSGMMARGKTYDINFKEIAEEAKKAECYSLLKNLSALESPEFQIKSDIKSENVAEIEKELISKQKAGDFSKFAEILLKALEIEKIEGEKNETFEKRLFDEFLKSIGAKGLNENIN